MRSPFRSESAAFHFLLLTVAAFAIVIAASLGGTVAAIVAWAVVSAVAVALYARGWERTEPEIVRHVGPPDERRVVVVAPLRASPLHVLANDVDAEQAAARDACRRGPGLAVRPARTDLDGGGGRSGRGGRRHAPHVRRR